MSKEMPPTDAPFTDFVRCTNCEAKGEVEQGTDICPACKSPDGTLAWAKPDPEDAHNYGSDTYIHDDCD